MRKRGIAMGDAGGGMRLDNLPDHLLCRVLQVGNLNAADLASLEVSCYAFSAAAGVGPNRFNSMPENAAIHSCRADPLFLRLPPALQSQLVRRCSGNWKKVLRFLQATRQAADGVVSGKGPIQVVAGKYLSFVINGLGQLFGCGSNQYSVLGQGPLVATCMRPVEVQVPTQASVKQVSGTHCHVAFVTEDGQVFTLGDNSSGCCGHGDGYGPICEPRLVETLRDIPCKQVSTGLSFTAALTREGNVYTWGSGSHGQLGHGDTTEHSWPVRVESLVAVGPATQVSVGGSYTLSVMENGDLYSFGYGGNYCLGHNDTNSEWQPRKVVLDVELFIISVSSGNEHAAAIDAKGQVYTWGRGYCGALGHGQEVDVRIPESVGALRNILAVQVSAKKRKTFVVSEAGDIYAFGWASFGGLGTHNGDPEKVLKPVLLPDHKVAQISAGFYHTIAVKANGLLVGFGDNEKGQLNFNPNFAQEN